MNATSLDSLREQVRGQIITPGDNEYDAARAVYNGMIDKRPAAVVRVSQVADVMAMMGPMPYPALNQAFDPLVPKGLQGYWKAHFLAELSDGAIAAHLEYGSRVPSVETAVHVHPIDGAVQREGPTETAFANRGVKFSPVVAGMWQDPADNEANIAWVRDYAAALQPCSGTAGYINFMDGDDLPRVPDNYRPNYSRLREVKAKYDPQNIFHINQNIAPA